MKVWHIPPTAEGITDIFTPSVARYFSQKKTKKILKSSVVSDKYLANLLTTHPDLYPYPFTISSSGKTHTIVISGIRETLRALNILLQLMETSGYYDQKSYVHLKTTRPNNYPLSPDAIEYDLFKDVFTDIKTNPEATFRIFKFFLKVSLISRTHLEQRAKCHIKSAKKRKMYCDFHRKRFYKITKLLPTIIGFNNFMAANPQIIETLISEFEAYNKILKPHDAYLRFDIPAIRKQFQQKYAMFLPTYNDTSLIKNEMQQILIDKLRIVADIEKKLSTLENNTTELFQNKADKTLLTDRFESLSRCRTKLTHYYHRIQTWPVKDHTAPYSLTAELHQINLMLEQLSTDLHNFPIINHALRLHRQIELMKRYYELYEHYELNEPKKSLLLCWAAIDNIRTRLNSPQTKNTEKLPDDIKANLNNIETVLTGLAFRLQRSRFSIDPLVNKRKDIPLDKTITVINKFNALEWQVLNKEYPGTFFCKIQSEILFERYGNRL